jgi:probable HAF family extracellular repeat protein
MKSIVTLIAAGSLLAAIATAQTRYTITDLGLVGGSPAAGPRFITNNGLVAGGAAIPDGKVQAVLWSKGKNQSTDIGAPGLGGPNSWAGGANESGSAVGGAQTNIPDNEDFCGFNAMGLPLSGTSCLPFVYQNGAMTKLPTLGGPNGFANVINNRGVVAGLAQKNTRDAGCSVSQFKPVIWTNGKIQELPTYPGDPDGTALGINDNGQVVGLSGPCAPFNANLGFYLLDSHALLWQDGKATDLGNLGGDGGFGGNHACAINNQGQVVGHSDLTGDTTFHAYLWTKETGMRDIGTLPGDFASLANAINDSGQVVGASLDSMFNLRAVAWQNGVPVDMNTLIPANTGLFLLIAGQINSRGQIVGIGVTSTGDVHGFLATPAPVTTATAGPKNSTVVGREITLDGTASISADDKPLTYQWSIPQGSPSAGILHGNTATPSVQFSPARGVYTFQLTVTDSSGTSASDVVTVNFQGN